MSLLRIHCSLREPPQQCQWALVSGDREPVVGAGPLVQLPQRAERVQLIIPAAEVLITRARLPETAKRHTGSVLAFAVEDETLGDPDANQVSWLGTVAGADVLAVADRAGLRQWHDALEAAGIRGYEVHCETLMLPWVAGEWSLAWDGREGFVRTGELEGATTDSAGPETPPLSLRIMLDEAKTRGEAPSSIAVYTTAPESAIDIEAWQRALGIAVRLAGRWDWRTASPDAGVSLMQERPRWRVAAGTLARLRPAVWIAGIALAIHTVALVADWTRLAAEQRGLRHKMETRFRAAFPKATAVVDPALQMRRQLAEARHAVSQPDDGDFLPMVVKVAASLKAVRAGKLRILSYESGRMTLELSGVDEAGVRAVVGRLVQAGMRAEAARGATREGGGTVVVTVRSS